MTQRALTRAEAAASFTSTPTRSAAAKQAGIKPTIGIEAYVGARSIADKHGKADVLPANDGVAATCRPVERRPTPRPLRHGSDVESAHDGGSETPNRNRQTNDWTSVRNPQTKALEAEARRLADAGIAAAEIAKRLNRSPARIREYLHDDPIG